jgi:type IV pilus assembly protein PilX
MKKRCLLKNENGSIMVIGLVMLMLLTLLGISATTTSTIEIRIAGNEIEYKRNLYLAEATALEFAQEMQDDPDLGNNPEIKALDSVTPDNIRDDTHWDGAGNSYQSDVDPKARYIPVFEGLAPGASLDMAKSTVNAYTIYGRSKENNAVAIVEIGYRRPF